MTLPRVLDLLALHEDVSRARAFEQGVAVSHAIAASLGGKPRVLEGLLGPAARPSREQLMRELPLPADYFEPNGGDGNG